MPRTRFGRYAAKPEQDPGIVAVRTRMFQLSIGYRELAEMTGRCYDSIRILLKQPPITWPAGTRQKILTALDLEQELIIRRRGNAG